MKIIFTMGLPGSGKTTWSKRYCIENNLYHCRFDDYIHNGHYSDLKELLKNECVKFTDFDGAILDHTFYSDDSILRALNILEAHINIDDVEIHHWMQNREKCLINDEYRKERNGYSCEITINNARLKYPDVGIFTKWEVKIMNHEILTKKDFIEKHGRNGVLWSYEWSLGGTWGNCWGDSGEVSADIQPSIFEEFDELLLNVCPGISYLMYKKLYSSSVTIETSSNRDYYGGSTEDARYVCDLGQLYDRLVEYKLL